MNHIKNNLVAGVVITVLGCAPAFAADLPVKAPVVVPVAVYSWTGCYIGASLGGAWQRDRGSDYFNGAITTSQPIGDADSSSVKVGGLIGCNWQSGQWVFGIEGDAEHVRLNGHADYANTGGPPPDSYNVNTTFQGSVRGRLGMAFDRSLLYVTGGGALARINHVYFQNGNGSTESFRKDRWGWTAGVGWEYAFSGNFTGRLEYRYADFGRVDNDTTIYAAGFIERQETTEHALRGALIYRFGR